ncbi:MAG: sulfatase [Thermoanaerobaculia bacterium]
MRLNRSKKLAIVGRHGCWVLLAAACAGCGGGPEPMLFGTRGYVLISIDTLRADHLGCYGYPRDTSPFLDSLAARGILFENAVVQLPGTLPSHMSIMTGLYPPEHGVYPPDGVLSPEIETLPELFQRHGFRTGGFTENGYVAGRYGFARGFDEFDDRIQGESDDVERTVARGLAFLRQLRAGERFFLFLHTYAVHDPYQPPEPYATQFDAVRPSDAFAPNGPNLAAFNRGRREISPQALAYYQAAYDASIRYVDDVLEGFFADLRDLGLADDLTVIVTSDHGEEFLEHGSMAHEQVYRETMRVPLIFLHPQVEPRRVPSLVESIDIAPTLAALAGLEPRPDSFSGRSFLDLVLGHNRPGVSEAYGESHDRKVRTVFQDSDAGLFQYLETEFSAGERATWVTRSLELDAVESPLRLEALSYRVPRRLEIEVGGRPTDRVELDPKQWSTFEIEMPPGKPKTRIKLSTEGCIAPSEVGESDDPRCLSFRVRGAPLRRIELFDLHRDPHGQADISALPEAPIRELGRRLRSYRLEPVAPAVSLELDVELESRLRALGYLQ